MKKEINDIIKVSLLADQLLQGVKVVEWMNSPNEYMFNDTPVEICLRGDGDSIVKYLEEKLAHTPGKYIDVQKAVQEAERAGGLVPSDEEIDGAEYPEHVIEQALIWACGNPSSAEKFLRGYSFALEQSQHTVCEDVLRDAIDSWDKYILSRKVVGKELDWDMFENAEKALKALRAAVGGE